MDWHFRSATELGRAVCERRIGAVALLEHFLARVERHNSVLNAIVVFDTERARARAEEAARAIARGEIWGPLHGVPITVKEAFDVAGLPTTWGVPALRENIPSKTAASVRGLVQAGAVIFGKTNVPYLISDWQSFNEIYGTTNNPWDVRLAPGGSSGGSAAALAAGLSALEIGSDIGASIRNPAHYCGVYGHKPTFGIVPQCGHGIPGARAPIDILVCGPLARSAEDLEVALDAMAGPEPSEAPAWRLQLPQARRTQMKDFRIAVMLEDPNSRVDSAVADRIQAVADAAASAGALVSDAARPELDTRRTHKLYLQLLRGATGSLLAPEVYAQYRDQVTRLRDDDDSYRARVLRGATQDHRSWFAANEERQTVREAWARFFEDYDLLLCPAAASAAFPHDHKRERPDRTILVNGLEENYNDQLFWAGISSLPNLPATVAPAGLTPAGLPTGVQIVGPYLHDRTTIAFARLLADAIGGFRPPPGYEEAPPQETAASTA